MEPVAILKRRGGGEKLPSECFLNFNLDVHVFSRRKLLHHRYIGSKLNKKRRSGSFSSVVLFYLNFFSSSRKRKSISSALLLRAFFLALGFKHSDEVCT
jgi:hypothetical protein